MVRFDLEEGKRMVDAFAYTSGVPCRLYSQQGKQLYAQCGQAASCALCRNIRGSPWAEDRCEEIHVHGALQAERFGGRYIYFCPFDMAFFSSPIMIDGVLAGALVAGPVLIIDSQEFLDDLPASTGDAPGNDADEIRRALGAIVQMEPARLNYLSEQLFANAVYISDSGHEMYLTRSAAQQQNIIGEYIQMLKLRDDHTPYPLDKEQELGEAVARGEKSTASRLLNEILGHILFSADDAEQIQSRMTELLVTMSRAAIRSGSDPALILDFDHRCLSQLRRVSSQEGMTRWMAQALDRFTDLVFDANDSKHKNCMAKTTEYLRANYAKKLTLVEVARYAGYSPSYFSKVFRDEQGCTFQEYLNRLRIEKSKYLLLSTMRPVAEICELVGFSDQSYFGKVFRRWTGVTPDRYRKRSRRIDPERELGAR